MSLRALIRIIKSKRMMWAVHAAQMGEKNDAYRLLVRKPEGKRPLRRPSFRWVENIKIDVVEILWDGVNWIGLVHDKEKRRALVNAVMNLRVTLNTGKLRVATQLVGSRVVLSSTELVSDYCSIIGASNDKKATGHCTVYIRTLSEERGVKG
jgi:hypothetical protein